MAQWPPAGDADLSYAAWAQGGEVDIVGRDPLTRKPAWATEIKWSNRFHEKPSDLKSLRKFCHAQKLARAVCTTIDKRGVRSTGGIEVTYVTSAEYAYGIGRGLVARNQSVSG